MRTLCSQSFASGHPELSGQPSIMVRRMQRPKEHVTDDRGDAILRAALAEWAVNRIEKDYGSDYLIEAFRDRKATGLKLNAQLKSSTVTAYSTDGTFISEKLDMEAAEYLAQCVQQPTFLFHADVEKGQLYWSAIQLDAKVLDSLENRKTKSLTVRIPTANKLPQEWNRFLRDIAAAQMTTLLRGLLIADDTDFVEAMRNQRLEKKDKAAESLQEKADRMKLQTAYEIFQTGNYQESKRRILEVIGNPGASIHARFNATVQLGDVEWTILVKSGLPQIRAAEQRLQTGRDLVAIATNGPKHLKLLALMSRTSGEFAVIVHTHHGLLMNWKAHRDNGRDPLWTAVLTSRLNAGLESQRRKYNQYLRLVRIATRSPYRLQAKSSLVNIVRETCGSILVMASCGLEDLAQDYRRSAYQLLRMAEALATEDNDDDVLLSISMVARILEGPVAGELSEWSRTIIERWPQGNEYRIRAEIFASHDALRKRGVRLDGDVVTTERQIMENMLTGYGINPSSEPWPRYIAQAVKDADLGRALKGCEHTFITPGRMPEILFRVGLELAGPKFIHCTLHKYGIGGNDLDTVNAAFTSKYCNGCKDKSPRPADWVYDHHFQDVENERWGNEF